MSPQRRERFAEQLAGIAAPAPLVPAGLAPFLRLPAAEARTLTRARMADAMAQAMARSGCVTEQDLAGFDPADVRALKREAARIAGLADMTI